MPPILPTPLRLLMLPTPPARSFSEPMLMPSRSVAQLNPARPAPRLPELELWCRCAPYWNCTCAACAPSAPLRLPVLASPTPPISPLLRLPPLTSPRHRLDPPPANGRLLMLVLVAAVLVGAVVEVGAVVAEEEEKMEVVAEEAMGGVAM
jgi:hypothetical protein